MDSKPETSHSSAEILQKIDEIWGDYDDFEEGGIEYVAFVISQDLQDMEEDDWSEEESMEELADICINALRMMHESGYDPTELIHDRLENHNEKHPPDLIDKYQQKFRNK